MHKVHGGPVFVSHLPKDSATAEEHTPLFGGSSSELVRHASLALTKVAGRRDLDHATIARITDAIAKFSDHSDSVRAAVHDIALRDSSVVTLQGSTREFLSAITDGSVTVHLSPSDISKFRTLTARAETTSDFTGVVGLVSEVTAAAHTAFVRAGFNTSHSVMQNLTEVAQFYNAMLLILQQQNTVSHKSPVDQAAVDAQNKAELRRTKSSDAVAAEERLDVLQDTLGKEQSFLTTGHSG